MRSSRFALLFLLLAGTACRPDTVELGYRYEQGAVLQYEMTASARASWNIGASGSGSYTIEYDVTEEVLDVEDGEATVSVTMTPGEIEEDGLPSPGPRARSFELRLGSDGQVLEIVSVDGVPAGSLEPDDLAFIGTYRPPLALDRVALRDTWDAEQEVSIGSVFQQVTTTGRLEHLDVKGVGPVATMSFEGSGPLVWTTTLAQGAAELTGSASSTGEADLVLEEGYLDSSVSTTSGRFEVRVTPEGGQSALTGTLRLDLTLELDRV
jgi:hypothetical protein